MPYLVIEKDLASTVKNLDERIKYIVNKNTIEIKLEDVVDWYGLNIRIREEFDADNYNISIQRKIPIWLFIFPDFMFNKLQYIFKPILCIKFSGDEQKS